MTSDGQSLTITSTIAFLFYLLPSFAFEYSSNWCVSTYVPHSLFSLYTRPYCAAVLYHKKIFIDFISRLYWWGHEGYRWESLNYFLTFCLWVELVKEWQTKQTLADKFVCQSKMTLLKTPSHLQRVNRPLYFSDIIIVLALNQLIILLVRSDVIIFDTPT